MPTSASFSPIDLTASSLHKAVLLNRSFPYRQSRPARRRPGLCIVKNISHNRLWWNFSVVAMSIIEWDRSCLRDVGSERFLAVMVRCWAIDVTVEVHEIMQKRVWASRVIRRVGQTPECLRRRLWGTLRSSERRVLQLLTQLVREVRRRASSFGNFIPSTRPAWLAGIVSRRNSGCLIGLLCHRDVPCVSLPAESSCVRSVRSQRHQCCRPARPRT